MTRRAGRRPDNDDNNRQRHHKSRFTIVLVKSFSHLPTRARYVIEITRSLAFAAIPSTSVCQCKTHARRTDEYDDLVYGENTFLFRLVIGFDVPTRAEELWPLTLDSHADPRLREKPCGRRASEKAFTHRQHERGKSLRPQTRAKPERAKTHFVSNLQACQNIAKRV